MNRFVNKLEIGSISYEVGTGFSFTVDAQYTASPLLGGAAPTVMVVVSTSFENCDAASLSLLSKLNPPTDAD